VPGVADHAAPAVDGLTTALSDLRPLAPRVGRAVGSLATLLDVIAPYAPETDTLLDRLASALGEGDHMSNWIRAVPVEEPDGQTPHAPPADRRNPYPKPGQVSKDGGR
jgi:hypothetical protein